MGAMMAGGRCRACVPRLPGAAGRRSRRGGSRTNCAKGVCLAATAPYPQSAPGRSRGRGEPRAPCRSENPSRSRGDRSGVPRRIRGAHASLSGALLGPARHRVGHPSPRSGEETSNARPLRSTTPAPARAHQRHQALHRLFVALLDQLGAAYGTTERARPLVAVLDNGPIHTSKLTTRALAERTWHTLEWLPKYAPELNDIERCWCDLKQHYLANRTFADADALARAIPDAVGRLNHERQLKSSPIRKRAAYLDYRYRAA